VVDKCRNDLPLGNRVKPESFRKIFYFLRPGLEIAIRKIAKDSEKSAFIAR